MYVGFGTICCFRHPLGVLEHILLRIREDNCKLTVIGFPETTGERAENSVQLIGCLSKMTHTNIGVQSEIWGRKAGNLEKAMDLEMGWIVWWKISYFHQFNLSNSCNGYDWKLFSANVFPFPYFLLSVSRDEPFCKSNIMMSEIQDLGSSTEIIWTVLSDILIQSCTARFHRWLW